MLKRLSPNFGCSKCVGRKEAIRKKDFFSFIYGRFKNKDVAGLSTNYTQAVDRLGLGFPPETPK
jgi:hypothetical protein